MAPGRLDVLGVGITPCSNAAILDQVARLVTDPRGHYVCVTGVHGVMESQRDPSLKDIHNSSSLVVPDGSPMSWAGRWAGLRQMERFRGPDLLLAACALAEARGWRSYFYGGGPGTADKLASRLIARFPDLLVAGTHSPPFRPLSVAEEAEEIDAINRSGAQLVWVGLSTPKQERWMARRVEALAPAVLVGVGAAFDIHAGLVPEPHPVVQRSGFEWAYRLARDPRRLWRRYLRNNPAFVASILRHPPTPRP